MSTPWKTTEEAAIARRLLRSTDAGILSTLSLELPGYPFGSVTPYALTHAGQVAVYVSEIAQHTHNMAADPRVCLTVTEQARGENQQAVGRVTLVGDAREVPAAENEAVTQRYFDFFPEAREYAGAHGFVTYWIEPKRVRYIGGFGKIFWVEPEDWVVPEPEWSGQERGIVEHMNADHADALRDIAKHHGAAVSNGAEIVTLDVEGFHVRADDGLLYVPFEGPCMNTEEVRGAMVHLARTCAGGA